MESVLTILILFFSPPITILFVYLFVYFCCTVGTLQHLHKRIIVEFIFCIILLYTPPPSLLQRFQQVYFTICIHVHLIHPAAPLSVYLLPSHWYQPLRQDLFSIFVKKKKKKERHFSEFPLIQVHFYFPPSNSTHPMNKKNRQG
jgi:hypothetical protein